MISVILPVYNEEKHLKENAPRIVMEMERIGQKYEIIIVEESTDKTPEIARSLEKKFSAIRHFHSVERRGKGGAVQEGIRRARGDKIIFMDIDLSVDLSSLGMLVSALDSCDVAVGSRYHPLSKTKRTFLRLLLGRSYGFLPRVFLGIRASDFQCGFKGFSKDAATKIIQIAKTPGVFWDTEALFAAKKLGYAIQEVPVNWIEKKTRVTKIGFKTIYMFFLSVLRLFFIDKFSSR